VQVPDSAWERLTNLVNQHNDVEVTVEQVRDQYLSHLQALEEQPRLGVAVEKPKPRTLPDQRVHLGPWTLSIGIAEISVEVWFRPETPWSADLKVALSVIGYEVWDGTINLSEDGAYTTIHPNIGVAKADVTLGIFGSDYCFRVYGEACYFAFFGWECTGFDETVYCFG
jgi:hypothetical protein